MKKETSIVDQLREAAFELEEDNPQNMRSLLIEASDIIDCLQAQNDIWVPKEYSGEGKTP